jgi:cytochrome c-type biogenesis protein CcmE
MGGIDKPVHHKHMSKRRERMYLVIISLLILAFATYLITNNFRDNIVFFRTPTEIKTKPPKNDEMIRVGGLVKEGSIKDLGEGNYEFVITDMESDLVVSYSGLLPALFREKQGVVARGMMDVDGSFKAQEILAKHDEKYMPPEVYRELEKRGYLEK